LPAPQEKVLSRSKRIFSLSLPIIGGMMSQNILNLVDTAMVGVLGNSSLAAIGLSNFVMFMSQSFIMGVSTAVQTMAARRIGEENTAGAWKVLNSALVVMFIIIPVVTIGLLFILPRLIPVLNSDTTVIDNSLAYARWRIYGTIFIGINFSFRGFWNAIDKSRIYMGVLIVINALNILFNYIFIFGKLGFPAMGVGGAGLASMIATCAGALIYFIIGFIMSGRRYFLTGFLTRKSILRLGTLSVPSSIQQFLFAAGFVVLFWIIGKVGIAELAAANVLLNLMMTALFPGMGFGMAASTLVSQALGRKNAEGARQWAFSVLKIAGVFMVSVGLLFALFPSFFMHLFIHDTTTVDLAATPMRIMGFTLGLEAVGIIFMFSLLGAGDNRRVMYVSIGTQWVLFLPLAYIIGPGLGFGLTAIWILQGVYRLVQSLILTLLWYQGKWAHITV